MIYGRIEEIWKCLHEIVREFMQLLQFFWHMQVLRIDVFWIKLKEPLYDVSLLLEQKLIFLLLFCFRLFLSHYALLN